MHATRTPGEQTLRIIAVLARPLADDGDVDQRHVEDRIGGLDEAETLATGYIPWPSSWGGRRCSTSGARQAKPSSRTTGVLTLTSWLTGDRH